MSKIVINNTTRKVEVHSTGRQGVPGPAGLTWIDAPWLIGMAYAERDALLHGRSTWRATVAHIATAATEPGIGSDWRSVWTIVALGPDPEPIIDAAVRRSIALNIVFGG